MAKSISAVSIARMLNYYYLVFFCPAEYIGELEKASQKMRANLAKEAGLKLDDFNDQVAPELARRIVAFQQATRKPDEEIIKELAVRLREADNSPEQAIAFQQSMKTIASHPARAKPTNRLHRLKGCDFCASPCRYAFFTLISEPDFKALQAMLDVENQKLAQERNAVHVLWVYTRQHLWKALGAQAGYITPLDLGNLSYCLLLLGTAKSRMALPEKQLMLYQSLNTRTIRDLGMTPIDLSVSGEKK